MPSPEPDDRPAQSPDTDHGTRSAIFGLARLAERSVFRTVGAVSKGSVDTAAGIASDITAGEPVSEIIDNSVGHLRSMAARALGVEQSDGAPWTNSSTEDVRAIGARLLYLSWRPENQPRDTHPAFRMILQSITPDEARIVRFLAVAGPQPSMDLRTKTPFQVGSKRLASGINLIANMAGCTWTDRDHHYLSNLNRLGLVRFSAEPVDDFRRYSLLTAQPKAIEVFHKVKKTQPIFRSIYLSEFGRQFAETCLPLDGYDGGGWARDTRDDRIAGKGPPWLRDSEK